MKTLLKAGLAYVWRFSLFLFLGVVINITLAIVYFGDIIALFHGQNIWLGVIVLATVIGFPILWFVLGQQEAIYASISKVLKESSDEIVSFVVDKFITDDKKDKIGDYMSTLKKQPKTVQIILGFLFEKIDFFTEVSELLKEKEYSKDELKLKMVEKIEEKELFEEWTPTLWTPFLLLIANIAIVIIAHKFI